MQLDLFYTTPGTSARAEARDEPIAAAIAPDEPDGADRRAGGFAPPGDLAEAVAWYDDAVSSHPRRAQIRSAFRVIGRALGRPLAQIPADPARLRPLLEKASPALAGIKPRSWIQTKSTASAGLRALGVETVPGRDATPLDPAWALLLEQLPNERLRIGVSRIVRCFSRIGVPPDRVDAAAFDAFAHELQALTLRAKSAGSHRKALSNWNKAVSCCPAWPQVPVEPPGDPRRYSLPWDAFPASFVADMEAFLAAKLHPDPLGDDYATATRAATARGRRQTLRQIASALILSGTVARDQLTDLAVLTEIEHVRAALRFLRDRHPDGDIGAGHVNMAWLLRTVARYWVKDEGRTRAIKALIRHMSDHRGGRAAAGITPKNRERLRQFDIPRNIDALLALPQAVLREVGRKPEPSYNDAVRVMFALMVGLLTFVPIRCKNLTELELGRNIVDVGRGSKRTVRLHLPAHATKTYRDYDAPIPTHLFPLLDAWTGTYRKHVCAKAGPYLFPNPRGELRSREALSVKLSKFVARETGLRVNPHLFRHIAAKLYLDHDPGGIEIVRQLLGHTSVRTTMRVYAELQADPAFQRFEEALLGVSARLPARRSSKRTGREGRS